MDQQRLYDQLEPINNSSVSIQEEAFKICQEQCTKETSGVRESDKSGLAAWHDDDDGDSFKYSNST